MNKKNMKKWMALFLSLAMILTSGVLTISDMYPLYWTM